MIAREMCRNRADLLIAGKQEESRRAAVALDARHEVVRLGMDELAPAMRWNRTAIVDIRVDERPKRARAFDDRVKIELQFAGKGKVGPLPGRNDDAIERTDGPRSC